MLSTEVVWHPGVQNGIFLCVYTTNNDFYLLSTDWFTTRALSAVVKSLTWLLTSMYFYFTVAESVTKEPKLAQIARWKKMSRGCRGWDVEALTNYKKSLHGEFMFVPLRSTP